MSHLIFIDCVIVSVDVVLWYSYAKDVEKGWLWATTNQLLRRLLLSVSIPVGRFRLRLRGGGSLAVGGFRGWLAHWGVNGRGGGGVLLLQG